MGEDDCKCQWNGVAGVGKGVRRAHLGGLAVEGVGGRSVLVDLRACVQRPRHWHFLGGSHDPVTAKRVHTVRCRQTTQGARFEGGQEVTCHGGAGRHDSAELFDLG